MNCLKIPLSLSRKRSADAVSAKRGSYRGLSTRAWKLGGQPSPPFQPSFRRSSVGLTTKKRVRPWPAWRQGVPTRPLSVSRLDDPTERLSPSRQPPSLPLRFLSAAALVGTEPAAARSASSSAGVGDRSQTRGQGRIGASGVGGEAPRAIGNRLGVGGGTGNRDSSPVTSLGSGISFRGGATPPTASLPGGAATHQAPNLHRRANTDVTGPVPEEALSESFTVLRHKQRQHRPMRESSLTLQHGGDAALPSGADDPPADPKGKRVSLKASPSFSGRGPVLLEDDFVVGITLGEGGYGSVRACRISEGSPLVDDEATQRILAEDGDKFLAVKTLPKKDNPCWYRELEMLEAIAETRGHAHAAAASEGEEEGEEEEVGSGALGRRSKDRWDILHLVRSYETDSEVHIVTKRYNGPDLHDYLVSKGSLGEGESLSLMHSMLKSIEACHRSGFAHLDVKLENFVFHPMRVGEGEEEKDKVVLIDFGSAEPFVRASYAERSYAYKLGKDDEVTLDRITGTSCYISPEVWQGRFSSRSDVWSAGVMFYTMIAGDRPYGHGQNSSLLESESAQFQQPEWNDVSSRTQELVRSMMHADSTARLSATEALEEIESIFEESPELAVF